MPDDLDILLHSTRAGLLDEIDGLDLDRVSARAARLRRRRRTAVASAAAASATLVATLWGWFGVGGSQAMPSPNGPSPGPTPTVTAPATATMAVHGASAWNGDDLSFPGAGVTDLPGDILDVEFVDGHAGYAALATCTDPTAGPCQITLHFTVNAGENWVQRTLPGEFATVAGTNDVRVIPLGATSLVLTGAGTWFSPDAGLSWQRRDVADDPAELVAIPDGGKLVLADEAGGPDCAGSQVDAWLPSGALGRLTHQPPIGVCWVANAEATGGVWWVGGRSIRGRPAVASSRDGGRSWTVVEFPTIATAPEAWPKVASVGSRTFVAIVSGRSDTRSLYVATQIMAIHRSGDGGHSFAPFAAYGLPQLGGDPVPLLDGRLLVASSGLSMGSPSGTVFTDAPPDVTYVRAIRQTDVGWVAYDLDHGGGAAYSTDGKVWHRLTIR